MSEFNYVEIGNISPEKNDATALESGDQLDFNMARDDLISAAGLIAFNTAKSARDTPMKFERPLTDAEQNAKAIAVSGLYTKTMRQRYLDLAA